MPGFPYDYIGPGSSVTGAGESDWYYGTIAAVMALLGTANLEIVSDLEDTVSSSSAADGVLSVAQAALIVRDGRIADAWFNSTMRGGTYLIPITVGSVALPDLTATDETRILFEDLSARYVASLLYDHRVLQSIGGRLSGDDLAVWAKQNKQDVIDKLLEIAGGDYELLADRDALDTGWRSGGDVTPITPCLHDNDVDRMACWGSRYPDAAPIWW